MAKIKGVTYSVTKVEKKAQIVPKKLYLRKPVKIICRITADDNKQVKLSSGIIIEHSWWVKGNIVSDDTRKAYRAYIVENSVRLLEWKNKIERIMTICQNHDKLQVSQIKDAMNFGLVKSFQDLDAYQNYNDAPGAFNTNKNFFEELERSNNAPKRTIADYLLEYASTGKTSKDKTNRQPLSEATKKKITMVARSWERFDPKGSITLDCLNANHVEQFTDFLGNETSVEGRGRGRSWLRSNNSIASMLATFATAIRHICPKYGIKVNNVTFKGIQKEHYPQGAKPYLNDDELKQLANYIPDHGADATILRAFIFQCLVGCRYSDLQGFTPDNIVNGCLCYQSHKTEAMTNVPLNATALRVLGDYRQNRVLFQLPSLVTYNAKIKAIMQQANINRQVTTYNGTKGSIVELWSIASSHMARRTFVGRLIGKGVHAEVIQPMSGHTKGSKAFARYYNITDEQKAEAVALLD